MESNKYHPFKLVDHGNEKSIILSDFTHFTGINDGH